MEIYCHDLHKSLIDLDIWHTVAKAHNTVIFLQTTVKPLI